mmetsp:Transcript_28284/g.81810  ORF Transcript_28284/g.81810 Transcript_28284/m.81810 type:complete len:267 (-) Transcript_28284:1311-2111(-)
MASSSSGASSFTPRYSLASGPMVTIGSASIMQDELSDMAALGHSMGSIMRWTAACNLVPPIVRSYSTRPFVSIVLATVSRYATAGDPVVTSRPNSLRSLSRTISMWSSPRPERSVADSVSSTHKLGSSTDKRLRASDSLACCSADSASTRTVRTGLGEATPARQTFPICSSAPAVPPPFFLPRPFLFPFPASSEARRMVSPVTTVLSPTRAHTSPLAHDPSSRLSNRPPANSSKLPTRSVLGGSGTSPGSGGVMILRVSLARILPE